MFTRMHKCTTIALAVAALAAGGANGGIERGIGDDPVRAPYSAAVETDTSRTGVTDGGFDWGDAGLGGALMLALVIALRGARIVGRRTLRTS